MQNKEKNFVSAVVYVRNEEKKIYDFLDKVNGILKDNFEKYEIICVNDASTDKSVEEIKRYAKTVKGGTISVLNMSFYQGLELSMNAGIDLSIGDFVYEFDSVKLTYPLDMIMNIYHHSLIGYDIVAAAPSHKQKLMSRMFYHVFNKTSNTQYMLRTEAFRILSRRAINRVHSMSATIPYRKVVYANCGLKMDCLEYDNEASASDGDRDSVKLQKETAVNVMVLYTDVAYKFSIVFSALMMLLTIFSGIYTIYTYMTGRPVAGWTTTMMFLSFAFFGIFVILTVLIKYVSLILDLNFSKQKYIMESIEKLNN